MKCLLGYLLIMRIISIFLYFIWNYLIYREELFLNIEKAPLKIPSYISPEAASLLKSVPFTSFFKIIFFKLLQRNPAKRLGSGKGDAEEIKFHPFFAKIDWNAVENRFFNYCSNYLISFYYKGN